MSEAALGARARDGDVDAFEQLLREHQAELFRLAFRMLGDRDQAQDVVVTTLLEGWRRLPASPRAMSFRIWMARTTMRHCLKRLAEPTTEPTTDQAADSATDLATDPDPGSGEGPGRKGALSLVPRMDDDEVAGSTGHVDLDDALDTLAPAERACWVLKELHDMSDVDIAQAMGVTEASVPGRVGRARLQLVTALAAA